MSTWHEYIQATGQIPEWPYPVNYDKINEVVTDVLVIGGGVAGLQAAINAVKKGVKVAVAERGHAKRSGSGGAGVDHWHGAVSNPCSKVTPEDYTLGCYESMQGWTGGNVRYIITKESWETLLECEKMGVQIRDVREEFKGANFRDEKTKLMFAYDYQSKHILPLLELITCGNEAVTTKSAINQTKSFQYSGHMLPFIIKKTGRNVIAIGCRYNSRNKLSTR